MLGWDILACVPIYPDLAPQSCAGLYPKLAGLLKVLDLYLRTKEPIPDK